LFFRIWGTPSWALSELIVIKGVISDFIEDSFTWFGGDVRQQGRGPKPGAGIASGRPSGLDCLGLGLVDYFGAVGLQHLEPRQELLAKLPCVGTLTGEVQHPDVLDPFPG
jgi:hypothetical protein